VLKRASCLALILASAFSLNLGASSAHDVSWAAENKPVYKAIPVQQAESDMPPVAPEHARPSATGARNQGSRATGPGYLTGSASATGSGASVRPQTPRYAAIPANAATLGADADQFLMSARKNEVVSPTAMKGWLDSTHPEFNLAAQNTPDQVIEVKGQWDDAGQILSNMGIRYERIKGRELRDVLSGNTKVVVINCEGRVPADQIELLRQWVIRGGYLITTDWALNNLVERAFPGIIAWSGNKSRGVVVDAMVVAPDSPLLAGTNVRRATWKLDEESQELKVIRPDTVQVLARSFILARSDKQRQFEPPMNTGVLACMFPYGRGRVLHLVGHFDYNSGFGFTRNVLPDAIPGAGVGLRQAIATNFLMEGLERKH
jgi:hypothetical protein